MTPPRSRPIPGPAPTLIGRVVDAYRMNSSRVAVVLLVLTNLIPLAGVLWLDWNLMLILALYWVENGIVGAINIVKILMARGTAPSSVRVSINGRPADSLSRAGTAGFFCVHYGIFWAVHGIFVFTFIPLIAGVDSGSSAANPFQALPDLGVLAFGTVGLAVSHGVSFWTNYVGGREYLALSPSALMIQPYGRLVILHVTIIVGAFVSIALGTPLGSLLVLVVLKTALDLAFHLRQHRTDRSHVILSPIGPD